MLKEFRDFAVKGNVVDMAVGIVIGAAFTAIVQSLVKDIITPPIGYVLGNVDFSNIYLILKDGKVAGPYASLKAAQDAGAITLNFGLFVNALISFTIVAFALFMVVKAINKLKKKQEAAPAKPTKDQELLTEIRDLLKTGADKS
ncbi:MAG: large conductance mechanosensitive channel protein MscL [Planctomycetota bacterium]|nr:large conductance mechanosensitive channel protein MscL [Planctomycetota bacterium]